jgi:hypothetical protein
MGEHTALALRLTFLIVPRQIEKAGRSEAGSSIFHSALQY